MNKRPLIALSVLGAVALGLSTGRVVAQDPVPASTESPASIVANHFAYLPLVQTAVVRYDDLPPANGNDFSVTQAWNHRNIIYFFQNGTNDVANDDERQAARDAFALWANATNLTFTEVNNSASADMVILWATGNHSDGNPFDGTNSVLAHAYYPPPTGGSLSGDVHFDDDETWTLNIRPNNQQPIDLGVVQK